MKKIIYIYIYISGISRFRDWEGSDPSLGLESISKTMVGEGIRDWGNLRWRSGSGILFKEIFFRNHVTLFECHFGEPKRETWKFSSVIKKEILKINREELHLSPQLIYERQLFYTRSRSNTFTTRLFGKMEGKKTSKREKNKKKREIFFFF